MRIYLSRLICLAMRKDAYPKFFRSTLLHLLDLSLMPSKSQSETTSRQMFTKVGLIIGLRRPAPGSAYRWRRAVDEVWISSMTLAGGIFPVNYLGATPRFFDLDPTSWL